MSIILYGVTSGGTSVPIEVTEEGKLVVDTSKFPTDEFIKQGDDIQADSIVIAGRLDIRDGFTVDGGSSISSGFYYRSDTGTNGLQLYKNGNDANNRTVAILTDGSITAGSATFAGTGIFGGDADNGANPGIRLTSVGAIQACRAAGNTAVFIGYTEGSSKQQLSLYADGSITSAGSASFASSQAGFTSDGELYFYSRGTRYKAVVQGGNVAAEPFTRATELREKAAKLREPRTQDIVPED